MEGAGPAGRGIVWQAIKTSRMAGNQDESFVRGMEGMEGYDGKVVLKVGRLT